jgi:hypothetical protein
MHPLSGFNSAMDVTKIPKLVPKNFIGPLAPGQIRTDKVRLVIRYRMGQSASMVDSRTLSVRGTQRRTEDEIISAFWDMAHSSSMGASDDMGIRRVNIYA